MPLPKAGPGRPSQDKERITVYIPSGMADEIRAQAEREFRPISDHVYYLLTLGLQARKGERK